MFKIIKRILLYGGLMAKKSKAKKRINTKILDFIDESDFDSNTKNFLYSCLEMEFLRDKKGSRNYFKDYDKIVDKYVE